MHCKCQFSDLEIEHLLLLLFNLATNGGFYYIVERGILPKLEMKFENKKIYVEKSEFIELCKYVSIYSNYFIAMILRIMMEWNVNSGIKYIYLFLLRQMVKGTLSNAAVCGKVIFFFLIKEKCTDNLSSNIVLGRTD